MSSPCADTAKLAGLCEFCGCSGAMFRLRETAEFFLTAQRRHFASETEKHRGIVLVFEYSVNSPLTRYAGALPEGEP